MTFEGLRGERPLTAAAKILYLAIFWYGQCSDNNFEPNFLSQPLHFPCK